MGQITVQSYMGEENMEFGRELSFGQRAIINACGHTGYLVKVDPTDDDDRLYTCSGNGAVVSFWDKGNGWGDVESVEGSDEDMDSFWQELECICAYDIEAAT